MSQGSKNSGRAGEDNLNVMHKVLTLLGLVILILGITFSTKLMKTRTNFCPSTLSMGDFDIINSTASCDDLVSQPGL